MRSYILELCPTDVGRDFYKTVRWSAEDAGVDLYVVEDATIKRFEPALLPLGVSARLIDAKTGADVHYNLVPRSSIFKSGVTMANSVGIIDKGYRGELKAPVIAFVEEVTIKAGARLFQIVSPNMDAIMNVKIVERLPETERGVGGFGSTGRF
jgi:dUTP pyrophosphatase